MMSLGATTKNISHTHRVGTTTIPINKSRLQRAAQNPNIYLLRRQLKVQIIYGIFASLFRRNKAFS